MKKNNNLFKNKIIWLVEDDDSLRWLLEKHLSSHEFTVHAFKFTYELTEYLANSSEKPDILISDIRMEMSHDDLSNISNENITSGLELAQFFSANHPEIPVIIMTAYNDLDTTVEAYQKGAFEFIAKPFDFTVLDSILEKAIISINSKAPSPLTSANNSDRYKNTIIGDSPAIQQIYQVIGKLSKSNMTVLLYGESGTGKELVARALHDNSPRKSQPFIALNTAAIPADLLEAELFGHEKGAFTGAVSQGKGHFEEANNGTLFLDEIGDMPLNLQTRLLRVLQDGQFYRVGGRSLVSTNVRIIAATNKKVSSLVEQGLFREDLYHRLNVMYIELPPLRDRMQDIEKLANYFLSKAAFELDNATKVFDPEAIHFLNKFYWPGNIRQLENMCYRLNAIVASNTLNLKDLPTEIQESHQGLSNPSLVDDNWLISLKNHIKNNLHSDKENLLSFYVDEIEKLLIEETLIHFKSNKLKTAKKLGCGRTTLDRKINSLLE